MNVFKAVNSEVEYVDIGLLGRKVEVHCAAVVKASNCFWFHFVLKIYLFYSVVYSQCI